MKMWIIKMVLYPSKWFRILLKGEISCPPLLEKGGKNICWLSPGKHYS